MSQWRRRKSGAVPRRCTGCSQGSLVAHARLLPSRDYRRAPARRSSTLSPAAPTVPHGPQHLHSRRRSRAQAELSSKDVPPALVLGAVPPPPALSTGQRPNAHSPGRLPFHAAPNRGRPCRLCSSKLARWPAPPTTRRRRSCAPRPARSLSDPIRRRPAALQARSSGARPPRTPRTRRSFLSGFVGQAARIAGGTLCVTAAGGRTAVSVPRPSPPALIGHAASLTPY